MGYFDRFKKHILGAVALFCLVPVTVLGGYVISLSFKYQDKVILVVGIAVIVIAVTLMIFAAVGAAKRLRPIEDATERLCNTLAEDERDIICNAAEGNPSKLIYSLIDYMAGRRMVSGSSTQQKELFEAAAECTDDIIWRWDENGDAYFIPEIWKSRYPGLELENGTRLEEYIHPDNVDEFRSAIEVMMAKAGRKTAINVQFKAGDRYISVGITARSSEIGGMVCAAGALSDCEKISEFETTIQEKYLMYHFALRAVSDIIYEVDVPTDTYCVLTPNQWNVMFSIPLNGDFSFHRAAYAELIHPDSREGFRDRFGNYDHLLFMPDRSITYDYRIQHKNGDWIWVRHSITCVKDEDGRVLKVIGHIRDINEKKRQEFRELYDHKHDALTGAFLRSTLDAEFDSLVKLQQKNIVVMKADIDNFKDIVEYYGYRAGDIILRQFVLALWESQQGRCSVGRIGNDDFIIIMKEVNEHNTPEVMAEHIFNLILDPIKIDNHQLVITASIGWSVYGTDGEDFDELIEKAEYACRKAHKSGRNRCEAYKEEMLV
ncbi:MAG: diguanylate cyclase [Ruminiclostridium sp.]|nr:diguanylate cyclase [Ruminiclostridium sp.]